MGQELIRYSDDVCVGCGDYAEYCDAAECQSIWVAHCDGVHDRCDVLACSESSTDCLDPFSARSVLNGAT